MQLNSSSLLISMSHSVYDIAIIGAGAAGLQLALTLKDDPFFEGKNIALIEKEQKDQNDRTWCYWEKGSGKFDEITTKTWDRAQFANSDRVLHLNLGNYRYKMVKAIDFYNFSKSQLSEADNIEWFNDEVTHIKTGPVNTIIGKNSEYSAKMVFDSRVEKEFYTAKDNYFRLLQHFKGWIIETEQNAFDPDSFTMMDFRLKWPDTTSFTYILPITQNKALVEFTFFSPDLIDDQGYEKYLQEYISEILKIKKFSIVSEEKGVIPMSDYPFHQSNTDSIVKIGTAGSWVKPSSGYSFKNAERYSAQMIENIKAGKAPSQGIFDNRFRKYDSLFLDVLWNYNHLGERIFSDMYSKNNTALILRFLDEGTNFIEELKIMSSFQKLPFTKALIKSLF